MQLGCAGEQREWMVEMVDRVLPVAMRKVFFVLSDYRMRKEVAFQNRFGPPVVPSSCRAHTCLVANLQALLIPRLEGRKLRLVTPQPSLHVQRLTFFYLANRVRLATS